VRIGLGGRGAPDRPRFCSASRRSVKKLDEGDPPPFGLPLKGVPGLVDPLAPWVAVPAGLPCGMKVAWTEYDRRELAHIISVK